MARIDEHADKLRAVVNALVADGYRLEDEYGKWMSQIDVAIDPVLAETRANVMSDGNVIGD
jgi:hypothetical protein